MGAAFNPNSRGDLWIYKTRLPPFIVGIAGVEADLLKKAHPKKCPGERPRESLARLSPLPLLRLSLSINIEK
jgi:hypothetical protein